jgi:hypothetical protein
VRIQYAPCIAISAAKAATVQGNARLGDGVSSNRTRYEDDAENLEC